VILAANTLFADDHAIMNVFLHDLDHTGLAVWENVADSVTQSFGL
jgi:hypothetical protein